MALIKTPDQRVRVFISSTIKELADERKAARSAIEKLRLISVYFEAGARPHPPRDLYTAYLEQSHIFLGIYWNSYGWVAPGSAISGLEDEYRLCGNKKPKLIYVKRSSERQAELVALLKDIERSDTACYQYFSDADELQQLIENDLSVLMSETFENALLGQQSAMTMENQPEIVLQKKQIELPHIRSEMYGRSEDLERLGELLLRKEANLITLLGSGGSGKSTLAIHTAHAIQNHFKDGVVFVPLAHITDPELVPQSIANVLNIQDSGKLNSEQLIMEFLSDKEYLLVLDNFEQVSVCAPLVNNLVTHCSNVSVLVTSRTPLRVRHERIYNLGPLELPEEGKKVLPEELRKYSATQLFVERALQVNPGMTLNEENAEAICEICKRMDGLPLAIELAAARTRFFQPAAILSRINRTLDLGSKGHKDMPERQQTLKAAIDWSYNLLEAEAKEVFCKLGVFKSSWTLDAADVILHDSIGMIDIEEFVERLLDVSLLKPVLISHSIEPRFTMLQTVQEYALEKLNSLPFAAETKKRYADYFLELCAESENKLWGRNGEAWLDKLETEYQNIRSAFYFCIETGDYERAWQLISYLSPYWIIRGGFSESRQWLSAAKMNDLDFVKKYPSNYRVKAKALIFGASIYGYFYEFNFLFPMVEYAQELLKVNPEDVDYGFAIGVDGCYGSYLGRPNSGEKIEKSIEIARAADDRMWLCMVFCYSNEYFRQKGRMDIVHRNMDEVDSLALEEGNLYWLSENLFIMRFGFELLTSNPNYENIIRNTLDLYHQLPAKGYKGKKASAMFNVAYSLMMLGRYEEAEAYLRPGLEYTRQVSDSESEIIGVLMASCWFKYFKSDEKAYTMMGVIDGFSNVSGFRFVGGQGRQYQTVKSRLAPEADLPANRRYYERGKHMSLKNAIMLALE